MQMNLPGGVLVVRIWDVEGGAPPECCGSCLLLPPSQLCQRAGGWRWSTMRLLPRCRSLELWLRGVVKRGKKGKGGGGGGENPYPDPGVSPCAGKLLWESRTWQPLTNICRRGGVWSRLESGELELLGAVCPHPPVCQKPTLGSFAVFQPPGV